MYIRFFVFYLFLFFFYCLFDFVVYIYLFFFFSSRRRHTRCLSDWSSDVCSSDLPFIEGRRSPSTFGETIEIATFGRMRNENARTMEIARRRLANYAAPGGAWDVRDRKSVV